VKQLILVAKAFADPTRVRLLTALRKQELCVCELCDALDITQSTLSSHLQVVRAAGLVRARREGKWMYYAIAPGAGRQVERLFQMSGSWTKDDPHLKRDRRRLARRLLLRDNGACCVGFEPSGGRTKK